MSSIALIRAQTATTKIGLTERDSGQELARNHLPHSETASTHTHKPLMSAENGILRRVVGGEQGLHRTNVIRAAANLPAVKLTEVSARTGRFFRENTRGLPTVSRTGRHYQHCTADHLSFDLQSLNALLRLLAISVERFSGLLHPRWPQNDLGVRWNGFARTPVLEK